MRRSAAAIALLVALIMLWFSLTLRSELPRAVAAFFAFGSTIYAWVSLRKKLQSRLPAILLGAGLSTLALACAWSGLNVVRYYLYDPAMERVGSYRAWFEIVSIAQAVLQWCVVVVLAFVVSLAMFPLWLRFRRAPSSKLKELS